MLGQRVEPSAAHTLAFDTAAGASPTTISTAQPGSSLAGPGNMAPKRTFGKSTSGPTATPQSNAPLGNGHRYDAAEKIWDGDPMTMSLWFVQTIEDLQDADPKFNRLVESATALTAKGQCGAIA